MVDPGMVFAPIAVLFGLVTVILVVLLPFYVIFDALFRQEEMEAVEKLIWVAVVVMFNIFGVIAYFVLVTQQESYLLDSTSLGSSRRLDRLEKLQELREEGALTDEEFQDEKSKLLDRD